jgi:exosortase/archaeosortase family protein
MLDMLGVRHLMEGNVLVLPGHRLLVEEACSGVNSLFALLIAASLFLVAVRRPLIWSGLLLAGSVCWAGLSNMGRVVSIALAQARYDVDWSTGWQHETLGFAITGLALLMLACTDRFLAFLLGPITRSDGSRPHNPMCRAWNWCVGGGEPRRAPAAAGATGGLPASVSSGRTENGLASVLIPVFASPHFRGPTSSRLGRLLVASFMGLAILQLAGLTASALRDSGQLFYAEQLGRQDLFSRSDLPATLAGWKQVAYTTEEHDRQMCDFRHIWTYRLEGCECMVSIDYAFLGWHELSKCYVGNGWRVLQRTETGSGAGAGQEPEFYAEVEMTKPSGERGLLLFSLFTESGRVCDIRPRGLADRLAANPLWNGLPGTERFAAQESTLQVQVFVSPPAPLLPAERAAVQRLFLTARQKLLAAYNVKQREAADE